MRAFLLLALAFGACDGTRGRILWRADAALPFEDAAPVAHDAGADAQVRDARPQVVSVVDPISSVQHGGTRGTAFADTCPESQAIMGFTGTIEPPASADDLGPFVGALTPDCAVLSLAAGALRSVQSESLPTRGMALEQPWQRSCPQGELIVGLEGRAGSALDQVTFACASFARAEGDVLLRGNVHLLPPVGGTGGEPFVELCPEGQLVMGVAGRAGFWVDALGIVCGTPTLSP